MNKIKGISFFCTAYYDEANISKVVTKAVNLFSKLCEDYEIIGVNYGSPDNTKAVVDGLAQKYDKVTAVHHPYNLGYDQVLRTGFKHAKKFDFVLFTDGDNQYDVRYFKDMVKYMGDYDAIVTYRTKNANNIIRKIISWLFNRVLNVIFLEPFWDLSSSLRLVRRSALRDIQLHSTTMFLGVEIILKFHQAGFKVKQLPIKTEKRLHGRSTSLLPKNFFGLIKDMLKIWVKDFLL
ncbi:MAG: glycosyltransferase family 2 protein [Candidatus Omnitrophota bacterium]